MIYSLNYRQTRPRPGKILVLALCWLLATLLPAMADSAIDYGATIFVYHRFNEPVYPATNIDLEQFEAHLAELRAGDYQVRPLSEIVAALRAGRSLPPRTVALTIDEAYSSAIKLAIPRIRKANLPVTIFISTDKLDRDSPEYASWHNLKKLTRDSNIEIGLHAAGYFDLISTEPVGVAAHLNRAESRIRSELGKVPPLFAYFYGDETRWLRELVRARGYQAAFTQNSSVAHPDLDMMALPRFPMTEDYGDITRFRLAASALPLPVLDERPRDPLLREIPKLFGFTVTDSMLDLSRLACFLTGSGVLPIQTLPGGIVRLAVPDNLPEGRMRINCTLPVEGGKWRWYGRQLRIPPGLMPDLAQPETPPQP